MFFFLWTRALKIHLNTWMTWMTNCGKNNKKSEPFYDWLQEWKPCVLFIVTRLFTPAWHSQKEKKKIGECYSVKKKKKKKDVFILSELDMYMFLLKHTPSHMQRLLFSSNDKAAHYHLAWANYGFTP